MIIRAFVEGELGHFLQAQAKAVERGAGKAMRIVTGAIRKKIAADVRRGGFRQGAGTGLAKLVRSRVRGKGADIEGVVYSKATYAASTRRPGGVVDLVQLFGQGAVIRAAGGGWLAIPTDNAWLKNARGPRGQRMSPREMIEAGARLSFLPAGGGRMVAVLRQRGASPRAIGTSIAGAESPRVVTHVLVPQVGLRKRYDIAGTVARYTGQFPEILEREINAAAEVSDVLRRVRRMTTPRERAIAAIVARLAAVGTFTVARNETAPATIPAGGHVVVRDGARDSVDRTLGIASWWVTHRVAVEAIAGGADPDGALDAVLGAIQQALAADGQLAPGVALVECDLAEMETISGDGAETFKAALIDVVIEYETSNPLD